MNEATIITVYQKEIPNEQACRRMNEYSVIKRLKGHLTRGRAQKEK